MDSVDDLDQMELVIAAGITACADKMETEIQRFTITTTLEVLTTACPPGTANVKVRYLIEKENLMDMSRL